MSNLAEKSTAFLIDEFFTTLMKCWYAQEFLMDESLSDKERLHHAIQIQVLNARRNEYIRLIDERLGEEDRSALEKTYSNEAHYDLFIEQKRERNRE